MKRDGFAIESGPTGWQADTEPPSKALVALYAEWRWERAAKRVERSQPKGQAENQPEPSVEAQELSKLERFVARGLRAGLLRLKRILNSELGASGPAKRVLKSDDGSQLLEFALSAPLLLVLIIGVFDFGGAYNLKQKLNNAVREGARYAANQNSDANDVNTTSINAVGTVVSNYLTNAGVTQCAVGSASGGPMDYTISSGTKGCGSFNLEVNRNVLITDSNGTVYRATKVTITYPVTWAIGNIMKVFLPSSTLNSTLPATVVTDATVQNIF